MALLITAFFAVDPSLAVNSVYKSPLNNAVISMWINEHQDWPNFTWVGEVLASGLADVRHRQGRLLGCMEGLGFELKREASLGTLTSDVVKSSAIGGENLNPGEVRSSIARRLGTDNERQRLVINRMLEDGFEGFMNTSEYARLAKCSNDTALRDIRVLKDRGILIRNPGGGRSTSYGLPVRNDG